MKYKLEITSNSAATWHVNTINATISKEIESGLVMIDKGDDDDPIIVHANNKRTLSKARTALCKQCKKRGIPFIAKDFILHT